MKSKAGFSLTEVLVAIAIIAVCSAIGYPVATAARLSANKGKTIENLRQLGLVLSLYRDNSGSRSEFGGVVDMGLPPHGNGSYAPKELTRVFGNNPESGFLSATWDIGATSEWADYTLKHESQSVLMYDDNFEKDMPKDHIWGKWQILALRLDGSVAHFDKQGYPFWLEWFHH